MVIIVLGIIFSLENVRCQTTKAIPPSRPEVNVNLLLLLLTCCVFLQKLCQVLT